MSHCLRIAVSAWLLLFAAAAAEASSPRILYPLERYPLSELVLVGTRVDGCEPQAFVRDPDGYLHTVLPGHLVGRDHGQVDTIAADGVVLVELVPDAEGAWQEVQRRWPVVAGASPAVDDPPDPEAGAYDGPGDWPGSAASRAFDLARRRFAGTVAAAVAVAGIDDDAVRQYLAQPGNYFVEFEETPTAFRVTFRPRPLAGADVDGQDRTYFVSGDGRKIVTTEPAR